MSVVNRMLQDIDRRRTAAGIAELSTSDTYVDSHAANPGIRSVVAAPARALRSRRLTGITLLLLVVGAAATLMWREWRDRSLREAAPHITAAAPSQAAVTNPSTVQTAVPVAPPVTAATESTTEAAEPVDSAAVNRLAIQPGAQSNVARTPIDKLKLSMQLSALVADTPTPRLPLKATPIARITSAMPTMPTTPSAPAASAPGITTITNSPVRQVAADETLVAARALWNEGSRGAALVTLREALAAAETARNARATVSLARELARLEVADGRAQVALDLLKRLEPMIGEDADAWALRGNAEQRLALHANAAESYLAALRFRPGEGKWMLGAAISLAAIGKLDEALAWVERARERDAVTPTIAAYLQQLGIGGRR